MKSFMLALQSLGKDPLEIGQIPPDPEFVDKYFNDSTGTGPQGETDERGPWNTDGFEYEESPVVASLSRTAGDRRRHRT